MRKHRQSKSNNFMTIDCWLKKIINFFLQIFCFIFNFKLHSKHSKCLNGVYHKKGRFYSKKDSEIRWLICGFVLCSVDDVCWLKFLAKRINLGKKLCKDCWNSCQLTIFEIPSCIYDFIKLTLDINQISNDFRSFDQSVRYSRKRFLDCCERGFL